MAPRSSWKGFLKLSLVSVPVKAYTANNTSEEIRLNQLHKDCHARVRYRKICEEHGELKSDEIISGYEYAKDQYVVIEPDELNKLRKESDRSVNIAGFVPIDDVDPIYHAGKTYYLVPDGVAGKKPYALLRQGMADLAVNAIGKIILSGREQLVLVRTRGDMIMMTVLHVAKKVKGADLFSDEIPSADTTDEERSLTQTLIEASTVEEFDFARYTDEYVERLGELIQLKIDGQEVVAAPDPEEPKIINLMDALKQSVAAAQASTDAAPAKKAKRASTKKAGSKKTATKKKLAPSASRKKAASKKRKTG